jgi:hypothetical protein
MMCIGLCVDVYFASWLSPTQAAKVLIGTAVAVFAYAVGKCLAARTRNTPEWHELPLQVVCHVAAHVCVSAAHFTMLYYFFDANANVHCLWIWGVGALPLVIYLASYAVETATLYSRLCSGNSGSSGGLAQACVSTA